MVNESIRIGIERNLTSLQSFNSALYHYFSGSTEFLKYYIARVIQIAKSKLSNFRNAKKRNPEAKIPHYRKPYVIVDTQLYKIIGTTLLIGVRPGKPHIGIPLNNYTMRRLSEHHIKIRAITITRNTICIAISKYTQSINPTEFVGIDTNLNNISTAHSDGIVNVFPITEITKIKEKYRKIKSKFRRNDVRIRRKIFQKYGRKQQHKTKQILHNISKKLTLQKKQIILEDLKGIRRLYRKGNCHSKEHRSKMNSWPFFEFKKQLEYKSKWHNGISVIVIKPWETSTRCSICGSKIIPEENRMIECRCGLVEDRDINAARNILYKGVKQLRGMRFVPDAPQVEVMKAAKRCQSRLR